MSNIFKAIADPTRREILLMLAEKPNSITNISEKFNMSRTAISKHIRILQSSNLVAIEIDKVDSRQRNCYAQLEALKELEDYLNKLEKYWKIKLNSLDNYLAKKNKL